MKCKKTDIIKYTLNGISIAIEVLILLAGTSAVLSKNHADMMDLVLLLSFFILLLISVASCIRIKKGSRLVLLTELLMKLTASWFGIFGFGVAYSGIDSSIIAMFIVGLCILGIVIFGCRFVSRGKKEAVSKPNEWNKPRRFESDKAKWAWDDAAIEYCRLHGKSINELTDKENNKIYEYAGSPMAYFLAWLIKCNFVSNEFKSEHDPRLLDEIKNEKASPIEFFGLEMDYVLLRDDLSEEILPFVDSYYYNDINGVRVYSHNWKRYIFDYYEAVRKEKGVYYCVDFSWEIYHKLEKLIFESYKYHLIYNEECVEEGETAKWNLLDEELEVEASEAVTTEYMDKCINHLNNLSDSVLDELCEELMQWNDFENKRDILQQIHSCSMVINTPQGDEPAFAIHGECDFDEEHGFSFVIRDDVILEVGGYIDFDSPWIYQNELKYKLAKSVKSLYLADIDTKDKLECEIKKGTLKEIHLNSFGSHSLGGNTVFVPTAVEEIKYKCDIIAECLTALGIADGYSYELEYKGKSMIPNKLCIKANKENKTVYRDSVEIH